MTAFDPMPTIRNILGMPPKTPKLPTRPGLYVPQGSDDLNDVTVWRLDPEGFWWRQSDTGVTAEEVAAANGGVALEALVRESEKDL